LTIPFRGSIKLYRALCQIKNKGDIMGRCRFFSVGDNILFKDEESREDLKGQIIDYDFYKRPDIRFFTVITEQGKEKEIREDQIIKKVKAGA
jgi:hypothetical protein